MHQILKCQKINKLNMKKKFLKLVFVLPAVFFAQPPADEPTVHVDNYTIPVLLLIIAVTYVVFSSRNTLINNNK